MSRWIGLLIAAVPLVLAVCFIISFVIYKRSNGEKKKFRNYAIVFGIIAGVLVILPFILVVAVIIGSMAFGLLVIVAIPIALADAFAIMLKRYIKNSDTDEIKRKRGIKAIILGSSAWVMMYALDSFLVFLLSGVISAM